MLRNSGRAMRSDLFDAKQRAFMTSAVYSLVYYQTFWCFRHWNRREAKGKLEPRVRGNKG